MFQYHFDTIFTQIPQYIAVLNIRLTDLADRLNLRVDEWQDLGFMKGFTVRLPSGLTVAADEDQTTIEYGALGPVIAIYGTQDIDIDSVLAEVLSEFGLDDSYIQSKRTSEGTWTYHE